MTLETSLRQLTSRLLVLGMRYTQVRRTAPRRCGDDLAATDVSCRYIPFVNPNAPLRHQTKKRACADRTNVPVKAAAIGKAKSSELPSATVQPTAAADRRARSRALLETPVAGEEEGAGECNQS